MRSKKRIALVIDTSVLRAAGGSSAQDPVATGCRSFLQAVLDICHKTVVTPEINVEWKQHQSRFASQWRASMAQRGTRKVRYLKPPFNSDLALRLEGCLKRESDRTALRKDLLLVDAALASDKTIVSLDESMRKLLRELSRQAPEISGIVWVNPTEPRLKMWLSKGAPAETARKLGAGAVK